MSNRNNYMFFDVESGSRNANKAQLTQIAAIAFDARKLEILPNGIFMSYCKPILDDEKAIEAGLDPIQQEALDITHITREQLEAAPDTEVVWKNFCAFVAGFKVGKSDWDNPIPTGFNIVNYDLKIIDRMCQKYGPWDDTWGIQRVFHPLDKFDVMHDIFRFTEDITINSKNSKSMDAVRKWMGISEDNAHDALKDCLDGYFLVKKFIKLYRWTGKKVQFENSFEEENKIIKQLMVTYAT